MHGTALGVVCRLKWNGFARAGARIVSVEKRVVSRMTGGGDGEGEEGTRGAVGYETQLAKEVDYIPYPHRLVPPMETEGGQSGAEGGGLRRHRGGLLQQGPKMVLKQCGSVAGTMFNGHNRPLPPLAPRSMVHSKHTRGGGAAQ